MESADLPIDRLTQAALLLPIEERVTLAARLIDSIEENVPVSEAWLDLAEQRRNEVLAGTAKTLSVQEVHANIRRHIP